MHKLRCGKCPNVDEHAKLRGLQRGVLRIADGQPGVHKLCVQYLLRSWGVEL